jgi:hypothetical protein
MVVTMLGLMLGLRFVLCRVKPTSLLGCAGYAGFYWLQIVSGKNKKN